MRDAEKFYITCAIDYVNSTPHLGTAYEKIAADALARYHRMIGHDVHFLLGNDEHSLNVQKAAKAKDMDPHAYTDLMETKFREVWDKFSCSYDVFIRTTEPRHHRAVQTMFRAIHDRGDIFKGKYEGYYCVSCEGFKQEKDLIEGNCPIHQTKPDWIEEENYFFKLSAYEKPLLELFENNPQWLVPKSRRNEILKVIEGGLEDISVSRPGTGWGIPLPIDEKQSIYVWVDALINYATAVGYGDPKEAEKFAKWWPADLHVIGKDITRFHCIIWPAMLLSAGVSLPKQVLGHGWVTFKGEKLSKSLGNIVDPLEAADKFGPDPLRYYLLKEVPLDRDGDFTWDLFIERYNTELANDLGNLVSRSVTMAVKYFEGALPEGVTLEKSGPDSEIQAVASQSIQDYQAAFQKLAIHEAIEATWKLVRRANQYIEETAPFKLAKDETQRERLGAVLTVLVESVRLVSVLMSPIMPATCEKIREIVKNAKPTESLTQDDLYWDPSRFKLSESLVKPKPLIPRIDYD